MRPIRWLVVFALLLVIVNPARSANLAEDVFTKRILPISESPESSSCVQCHLSGVELKDYILETHEKTFRSLRDQGLIDMAKPRQSKILKLIDMKEEGTTKSQAKFDKKRQAELEAFTLWIEACSKDSTLKELPALAKLERAKPAHNDAIIRHNRKDRLLQSFEKTIWAARFRCVSCHESGRKGAERHRKKFGESVIWVKESPQATMDYLIRETKLLDTAEPTKSLLLTKPLNEVKHQGGQKFRYGDQGYASFRRWLEDYAAVAKGKYSKVAELPKDDGSVSIPSKMWLRFRNTPEEWGGKMLEVRLFEWNREARAWGKNPVAVMDNPVVKPRRLWHSNLMLTAPRESDRARAWGKGEPSLAPGRYKAVVYLDRKDRRSKEWDAELGEDDKVGQVEFTTRWPIGFGMATVIQASRIE